MAHHNHASFEILQILFQHCLLYTSRLFMVERKGKLGLGTAYLAGFKWALQRGYEYIFEIDVYKRQLNIRSLIASQEEDSKDLLDLCIDVIYHNNMKAFGLQQLIKLYLQ